MILAILYCYYCVCFSILNLNGYACNATATLSLMLHGDRCSSVQSLSSARQHAIALVSSAVSDRICNVLLHARSSSLQSSCCCNLAQL